MLLPALLMTLGIVVPLDVRLREGFQVPAPTGREAALLEDARDGKLDDFDLATAALVVSGVDDARLATARARLLEAVASARQQAATQTEPKKRGERLLQALHETVLLAYSENQSSVDAVVSTGGFNCLSSAIVFLVASEGLFENPRGMLSRTHAFARVELDGKPVDVETTTPFGFAADRKKLLTPEFLRARGVGAGLTEAERRADLEHPEEVPITGLLAAGYSNRGAMLVARGDLEGAAVAFDRATRLATGAERARFAGWRAALLNNATQGLLDAGRLHDAQTLLSLALDGAEGTTRSVLLENLSTVTLLEAEGAARDERFREARALLDDALPHLAAKNRARADQLSAELAGRLAGEAGDQSRCAQDGGAARAHCLATAAGVFLESGALDRALATAREAHALDPSDDAATVVLFNALMSNLNLAMRAGACERVETLSREALGLRRSDSFSAAEASGGCWWKRGEAAAEAKDFERAAAEFQRARVHLPNDVSLKKNLRLADLHRARALALSLRCDEARAIIRQSPDDDGVGARLLEKCANDRGGEKADKSDWAGVVVELRRGLRDAPKSTLLAANLVGALHNLTMTLLAQGRCDDARALLPELEQRHLDKEARQVRARCAK